MLLTSKLFATGVLALGLCFGTTIVRSQRQPQTFFKTKIGLSESDIQEMDQGHVVTKVLESADKKYGVLVFGGVHINASIEQFVASYRDVKTLLEDKVYRDVQEFNATVIRPDRQGVDLANSRNKSGRSYAISATASGDVRHSIFLARA